MASLARRSASAMRSAGESRSRGSSMLISCDRMSMAIALATSPAAWPPMPSATMNSPRSRFALAYRLSSLSDRIRPTSVPIPTARSTISFSRRDSAPLGSLCASGRVAKFPKLPDRPYGRQAIARRWSESPAFPELETPEPFVDSALADERAVSTALDDLAMVQNEDLVGGHYRAQA